MAKFDSKENLLSKIDEIYSAMSNGTIEIQQLDELVSLSEELHQRNIIIRYKAFEAKVFGETSKVISDVISEDKLEEKEEVLFSIETNEPEVESMPISFSLFEEPILPLFDLASEPVVEPVKEEIQEKVQEEIATSFFQEEPVQVIESLLEEPEEESIIEVDNSFSIETQTIEEPIIHSEEIVTEYEDHSIEIEHTTILEDPETHEIIEESHSYEAISIDEQAISSFMHKFKEIEHTLANQFGISKLDTLVGSFGLNERLQYINELFDGSSEDFSNAVKTLDNQSSSQNAFLKVAEIGTLNNWDIQSETVEEFMQKIKRRYYA
jgi:hypothetical protein